MIKIIAGKYKNLSIPIARNATYRPSTGRFREAVFSILTSGKFADQQYSMVLDLFSGSGSLGLEALSRGAKFVSFIDINRDYLKTIEQFVKIIGAIPASDTHVQFLCLNALRLPQSSCGYDIVFIDPPYHNKFTGQSLNSLLVGNWLNNEALIIIELAKTDDLVLPDSYNIQLIMERIYGNNKLLILQFIKS
ncbi:16S rRNA (guanine(966)-N(2))-methyltransferase RsmD [Candidatus Trichorickettsia mobilis]|uniref:16S rRNA (guanine(966)-N(2))-methyltransferase RsmD n=1 Tax=Candidatus Trichorickettsia mobilis TaxID=1346319 RepID=UPI00292EA1D3|nr:16S rRNA (guanine(966)-N(2))-methyltransferase RsmD [Candidatus Trichorickettsia mobilis]